MTVLALGPVFSGVLGKAKALDLTTMSIGFSSNVSIAFTGKKSFCVLAGVACSLMVASVISASGVPCSWDASGVAEGFGVGKERRSVGAETSLFLVGAALFRFLGGALFDGDTGCGGILCSGSKTKSVPISSVFRVTRLRAAVRGVGGTSVVFRRVWRFGLRCGAGVKPSSESSSSAGWSLSTSSSESSTMIFFRVAALREGRLGDIVAIALEVVICVGVAIVYYLNVYHPALPVLAPDLVATKPRADRC